MTIHLHECISRILRCSNCTANSYPGKNNFYSDHNWQCDEKAANERYFVVDFQYFLLPPKSLNFVDMEERKVRKLWARVSPKQPSGALSPVLHLYILQQESECYVEKFELVDS